MTDAGCPSKGCSQRGFLPQIDGPIRANRFADSRESPDSRESFQGSRTELGESLRGNRIGATGRRASERKSASERVSERVSERGGFQRYLRGFERFSEVFRGSQRFLEVFRDF